MRSLEATRDIAVAIGGMTDLERVLELIAKRGRALVDARTVLIMLREGDELVVAARAGQPVGARGRRLPIASSAVGEVLARGRPQRVTGVAARLRMAPVELGIRDARTALLVPMLHRRARVGVLAAFDRGSSGEAFTDADEQLLFTFATQAANGVAIARSVEADRLRAAVAAAEAERGRWARELHDDTLQTFGAAAPAARRCPASGRDRPLRERDPRRRERPGGRDRGVTRDHLGPASTALDDLGLKPALEALLERRRRDGLKITAELELPDRQTLDAAGDPELDTAIYRIVQEALTNVVKHAHASTVRVDAQIIVEVQDDGVGFDPNRRTAGSVLPE
ncbi:MAG TPA: GAF domain-containing protein [Solirubrobacteraceae bacterium]|nr:GAF domain-containing protein [Solirubrobacteraceae bacterium]